MTRIAALLVSVLMSGCVVSFGGPTEHSPVVERLMTPPKERPLWNTTWGLTTAEREGLFLTPVGAPGRTDDSPFWIGPNGTAFVGPTAENGGKPGPFEEKVRRGELETEFDKRRVEERARTDPATGEAYPEPSDRRLGDAVDAYQGYLRSRGIPPVDVSPASKKPEKPPQVGP